jgi:putative phosphoesterase
MKLLVTSDSHGNYPLLFRASDAAAPLDAVIHLGDGSDDADLLGQTVGLEIICVAGNCDRNISAPRELLWECSGHRFLLTHGDVYGVKNGLFQLEHRALQLGTNVVLYGHSHLAAITTRSGILFVNPGTLMKRGNRTTYATLEINSDGITPFLHDIA